MRLRTRLAAALATVALCACAVPAAPLAPRLAAPLPSASPPEPSPAPAPLPATSSAEPDTAPRIELPLFRRFPALKSSLPRVPLDPLFTPVSSLDALAARLGLAALLVKRDDRLGDPFGGSKVRKLEFLFGEAQAQHRTSVVTFGGLASNHALASALYARAQGLHAVLLLLPEPPTARARENLLALRSLGAELHLVGNDRIDATLARKAARARDPQAPFVIEPGGTSPLGCVGYVNAAFELQQQIEEGQLPRPDVLFVAAGTGGTTVGLLVGLAASGLSIPVRAVRVASTRYVNLARLRKLFDATCALLRERDPSFPQLRFDDVPFEVVQGQAGAGYALPTRAGQDAVKLVGEASGIQLDTTYTGKAMAALLAQAPTWQGRRVLFWNTYDPRRLPLDGVSPSDLPPEFRGFFPSANR